MNPPALHNSSFDLWCSRAVYETTYGVAAASFTLGWGLRTRGRNRIPATGPAILVANHQSFLDPLLVGLSTRRHLCYLARKTLFRHTGLAWLIRMLNAVPIDQEGVGKDGIKIILAQLELGRAVVIFPEGTRTNDGAVHQLRPGIHLLIKKARVPVVPIGIAGAYEAWPCWKAYPLPDPIFMPATTRRIAVAVGKPFPSSYFSCVSREDCLQELFEALVGYQKQAEQLRGRAGR